MNPFVGGMEVTMNPLAGAGDAGMEVTMNLELINYYLQDDRLLCIDKTLLRYEPIQISKCLGAEYYDNVKHLIWDWKEIPFEEIPVDFVFPRALKQLTCKDSFDILILKHSHKINHKEVDLRALPIIHLTFPPLNEEVNLEGLPLTHLTPLTLEYSQPRIDKRLIRLLG